MPEASDEGSSLSTAEVSSGGELLDRILESMKAVYGRDPRVARHELEAGRARLHAIFEEGRLAGYLFLAACLDPLFHIGNRIDVRIARRILEDRRSRVWSILLLHGEPGTEHDLAELAEAMLRAAAAESPEDTVFLVSLGRGGDPRSWRLFREVGFREEGAASWLAEIPVHPSGESGLRIPRASPGITWFSEAGEIPAAQLADAYNDVFGEGTMILSPEAVEAVLSSPGFFPELSAFSREGLTGKVTAFLLASRRDAGAAHIDCVGVREGWRGRGLLEGGFGAFRERARAAGIARCTFVTGRPEVRKYAERRMGARALDELVWLLRRGAAGGSCSNGAE